MSSDAVLSIVALLVPALVVVGLVVPVGGRAWSRSPPRADLGPSGTEIVPPVPSPRSVPPGRVRAERRDDSVAAANRRRRPRRRVLVAVGVTAIAVAAALAVR